MARGIGIALLLLTAVPLRAQDVPFEYQVKAAFIFNFIGFVDWPPAAQTGPFTICVAGRNPLGSELDRAVRGESIGGRPIQARIILEPDRQCRVVFVPRGSAAAAYLKAARNSPVLTIGETDDFLDLGGTIAFYLENGRVRFEISPVAAERSQLRISSRLLQLARIRNPGSEGR